MPTVSFDLGLFYFAMFSILSASKSKKKSVKGCKLISQQLSFGFLEDFTSLKWMMSPQIHHEKKI